MAQAEESGPGDSSVPSVIYMSRHTAPSSVVRVPWRCGREYGVWTPGGVCHEHGGEGRHCSGESLALGAVGLVRPVEQAVQAVRAFLEHEGWWRARRRRRGMHRSPESVSRTIGADCVGATLPAVSHRREYARLEGTYTARYRPRPVRRMREVPTKRSSVLRTALMLLLSVARPSAAATSRARTSTSPTSAK